MTKRHRHTVDCYLNDRRGLIYKPCRADGTDRNLTHLTEVDFHAGLGVAGVTLVCKLPGYTVDWSQPNGELLT